jgi:hypothetical protein
MDDASQSVSDRSGIIYIFPRQEPDVQQRQRLAQAEKDLLAFEWRYRGFGDDIRQMVRTARERLAERLQEASRPG